MLALLVVTRILLRRHDTTTTMQRLTRRSTGAIVAPVAAMQPVTAMRAVRRAARVVGGNCLAQSVALAAGLQRAGSAPELILGCRRYGKQEWGAHAWVRVDGQTLDPLPSGRHHALAGLGAGTAWIPTPVAELGGITE